MTTLDPTLAVSVDHPSPNFRHPQAGTLAGGLVHAASFVLSIVVVLLLYRFVPPRGLRFRDGLVGAIITALLLRADLPRLGLDLREDNQLNVVYGSLTSALVFLYSMYLYSSALLLSAEVAAAWSRPQRADPHPAETRPARTLRQAEGVAGR